MRAAQSKCLFLALALWLGGVSAAPAASLLVNGSFEQGSADPSNTPAGFLAVGVGETTITGWEVFNNPLDWIAWLWPASDGLNSVDLDGSFTSGIRQTFATVPGQTYSVTFDMGGNLSGSPAIKPLRVSADGQSAKFYVDTTGYTQMTYVQQSWSFVADDTSATLEFRSLTDDLAENPGGVQAYGPVIDNVSAVAAPEPTTLSLLGIGTFAVFGTAARRRRSAGGVPRRA